MEMPRSYSLIIHLFMNNSLLKGPLLPGKTLRGETFLGRTLKRTLFLAPIILAALLSPSRANASTIVYDGTTEGGPTWNRPDANGVDAARGVELGWRRRPL